MTARVGRRVHPNSLAAFQSIDLGRRQGQVLAAISDLWREGRRPCDADIASFLSWPINQITGRRHELAEAGRIVRAGNKLGSSGRRVAVWRPAAVQLELLERPR